ncbi:MAG TPA: radical SAM protein [Terriglobales bacterium]|nr:radical SAM protein [Terriglobales bacterium]
MRFDSILIVLTEVCHVGCQHCGYIGSKRDREVEAPEVERWIEQMIAYGIPEIIFTGGEAFERYETLAAGVKRAKECGARISVFTSSFWASSRDEAIRVLHGLDGLTKVYLSTDVYHQKRVPFQYVRNAVDAAIHLGIPDININITYATEADRNYVAAQYEDYGNRVRIYAERVIPSPKFSPKVLAGQDPMRSFAPQNYSRKCWLGTPLVDPQGDVFACHIGKAAAHKDFGKSSYFLGNLRSASFEDIMMQGQQRADYQFLRTHGPVGVASMAMASPELLKEMPRHEFTNDCDMCVCTLGAAQGPESLEKYAEERVDEINIRLALLHGESPTVHSGATALMNRSVRSSDLVTITLG